MKKILIYGHGGALVLSFTKVKKNQNDVTDFL